MTEVKMLKNYSHNKPVIGVTLGDAAGIGSEIVAKAASSGVLQEYAQAIIVGDERLLKRGMRIAKVSFEYQVASSIEEAVKLEGLVLLDTKSIDADSVELAEINPICGKDAATNIGLCVEYCKQGFMDGICFGPNNKKASP